MKQLYKVLLTATFKEKANSIKKYYGSTDSLGMVYHVNYVIKNCIKQVEYFPRSNPATIFHNKVNYRKYIQKDFIIIYEIDEEKKIVYLIELFHRKEDYLRIYT